MNGAGLNLTVPTNTPVHDMLVDMKRTILIGDVGIA